MVHPFAELIGLVFDSHGPGGSVCRIEAHERLYNPQNVVHGGVLYALADTGMGGALYPLLEAGAYCATIEIKITYFKPITGGTIECSSKLINKGKTIASLESEIRNQGRLAAKASGSFSIFKPKR